MPPRRDDASRRHSPRVELYQRLVAAIDDGTYPPGARLPAEPVLAGQLGVSRPALREVLILLQEDGVITRRQGSGSTVNHRPPAPGLERLRPVEELLGPGAVRVRRLAVELEEPTDFSGFHLRLGPADRTRFWETAVELDGAAACFAHEWAAEESVLERLEPALAKALAAPDSPSTMLATLLDTAGHLPLSARSTIGATVLGSDRGAALSRPPETPAILITQTVSTSGTPLLAAKYLLPSGAPLLQLMHRQ